MLKWFFLFYYKWQFSVPQMEYPLGGSSKKGSHVYFLLIVAMVLLLWRQIVLLLHQATMIASEHLYKIIVQFNKSIILPRKLLTLLYSYSYPTNTQRHVQTNWLHTCFRKQYWPMTLLWPSHTSPQTARTITDALIVFLNNINNTKQHPSHHAITKTF